MNLLSHRTPLDQVVAYFEEYDVEELFEPGIRAEDFDDDGMGRALDKLYASEPRKVFTTLAMKVMA